MNNQICETCKWLYKEHCCNGESDNCTESASDNENCEEWEEKNE